jgi:hypothetical protein
MRGGVYVEVGMGIVVYRPTGRQRPRNKQQDNSCCLAMISKHVNDIQAIARQPPIARIEELLGVVFSVGSALGL